MIVKRAGILFAVQADRPRVRTISPVMIMENGKILVVVVHTKGVVAALRSLDPDDRCAGICISIIRHRILGFRNGLIPVFYNNFRADFRPGIFIGRIFIRIPNDLDFQIAAKESLGSDRKRRFHGSFIISNTGYDHLGSARMDIVFIGNRIAYIFRQGCKAVAERYPSDLRLLRIPVIVPGTFLQRNGSTLDGISQDRICLLRFYRPGSSLFRHRTVNLFPDIRLLDRVSTRLPGCCTGRCLNDFLLISVYTIPCVNIASFAAAFIRKSRCQLCSDPCRRRDAVSDFQIQLSGQRRKRNDLDVVSPARQRGCTRSFVAAGQIFHTVAVLDLIGSAD